MTLHDLVAEYFTARGYTRAETEEALAIVKEPEICRQEIPENDVAEARLIVERQLDEILYKLNEMN